MSSVVYLKLEGNQKFVRDSLIQKFLEEPKGSGNYRYIVERPPEGEVALIRPTIRNKGVDFAVELSGFEFRSLKKNGHRLAMADRVRPKHGDIIKILLALQREESRYKLIQDAIHEIYLNNSTDFRILDDIATYHEIAEKTISGHAVCALIKWLFIEQDVTYWTGLGRDMFYTLMKDEKVL